MRLVGSDCPLVSVVVMVDTTVVEDGAGAEDAVGVVGAALPEMLAVDEGWAGCCPWAKHTCKASRPRPRTVPMRFLSIILMDLDWALSRKRLGRVRLISSTLLRFAWS